MLNVIKVSLPECCRILCISDIHTHWREMDKLLKQCNYCAGEDYMFILGDILERGEDNIDALRYVMELAKEERVVVISGNNDMFVHDFAVRYSEEKFHERFTKKPNRCFVQMGEAIGITDYADSTAQKRRAVYEAFRPEIDFVKGLPDAIETDSHVFVHAGIEGQDWHAMDAARAQNIKRFPNLGHESEKTVVCGHVPCYGIGRQNSNLPILDEMRRIIAIDGGAGVKQASQVNAVIINKCGGEYSYETEFCPIGEPKTVLADHTGREGWSFSDYSRHLFTQIPFEPGNSLSGFVKIQNKETGEQGVVPECFSGYWDGSWHAWGNLNAFPSVKKGEPIWTYAEYGDYCWCITADGEIGSVPKSIISEYFKTRK